MVAVIGHGEGFGGAFGLVVDTPWPDRVDVAPVGFGLGMHQRVAIDFRGRGEDEAGARLPRQVQGVVSAHGAHFQGLDGPAVVVVGAGGRREVEEVVDAPFDFEGLADVVADEAEPVGRQ